MSWLSSFFGDQRDKLKTVLPNLRFSKQWGAFQYPAYILPVEQIGNSMYGLFESDGEMSASLVGFKLSGWISSSYYHSDKGDMVKVDGSLNGDTVYFPLKLSDHDCNITADGKSKACRLLTIEGLQEKGILAIMMRAAEGLKIVYLYKSDTGLLYSAYIKLRPKDYEGTELKKYADSIFGVGSYPPPDRAYPPAPEIKKSASKPELKKFKICDPSSIVQELDKTVIGQHEAKKAAAIVLSNYLARKQSGDDKLPKESLLFVGPSGCGKTMILKKLAEMSGVPFVKASLSNKSSTGYVGYNLSDVFKQLLKEGSKDDAPYAIVFLDEVDKIAMDPHFMNDYGPRLQDEIIGWVEGDRIMLDSYESGKRTESWLDTKNLLFVFAGAFHSKNCGTSLYDLIESRIKGKKRMGFGSEERKQSGATLAFLTQADLISYGFKPELVGRFSHIAALDELDEDSMVRILRDSEDSILERYARLFTIKGYSLGVCEDAMRSIVRMRDRSTGARSLNVLCSRLVTALLYDPKMYADKNRIDVDEEMVEELLCNDRKDCKEKEALKA